MYRSFKELYEHLQKSKFRSSFHLKKKELDYLEQKGFETITKHAYDFVEKRLAPAYPENDGKQTPMKGHPVFVAQHATGCCCRGCLEKWHGIPQGKQLTAKEQEYIVSVLMHWIDYDSKR